MLDTSTLIKASQNKLLSKSSTSNEMWFTSHEQSVSVENISVGKKSQAGLCPAAIFGFPLSLCAGASLSANSSMQSPKLILCKP